MNNKNKSLRAFEAFAGYGSQSLALRNIGINHEVVAISEIDKYALKAYYSLHDENIPNLGDISALKVEEVPPHDLFTYSFPCTDISVAGKQEGIIKGQTRSGLLYECERIIEHCKPKYLLMENVKNLVGKKFKKQFEEWLAYLEQLGYTNYWKVLNAKDYGIPQNRERVFCISVLGEHKPYKFPEPIKLDKAIKDVLEEEVEDKYYLNKKWHFTTNNEIKHNQGEIAQIDNANYAATRSIQDVNKLCRCLDTMSGGQREPKILCEGNVNPSGHGMNGNVFHENGISPTLTTNKGEGTKIVCEQCSDEGLRFFKNNVSGAIRTSNSGGDKRVIELPQATKKGYIEMEVPGICDLSYPTSKTRRGRVQEKGKISPCIAATQQDICYIELPCIAASRGRNPENPSDRTVGAPTKQRLEFNTKDTSNTITTVQKDNYVVEKKFRIRKLTPRECFRLMGLKDTDIDKIQETGISNSQQYKMAGNSIVVNVLEEIFKNLFI